jgi:hypothetical protein
MTTGAADPFRFRRIENRAGGPYPGGRAGPECQPEPGRTGPVWGRFGFYSGGLCLPHRTEPTNPTPSMT